MRYGRPIEEYIEHFAPVLAAGLCAGPMGNSPPQAIAEKATAIVEFLGKKQGMKTAAQLDAEAEAEAEEGTADMKKLWLFLLLAGCAGWSRDCQSCGAENFGSDWIVVQYRNDGSPINCWMLRNTAIDNEHNTDGIYWQSQSGHLVHISGWYNRVQVTGGRFKEAATQLNINYDACTEGAYIVDAGRWRMNKKTKKKFKKPSYKKHKGKKAQIVRAHNPEPSMYAFRVKMNFFPQHGDKLDNVQVGRKLHELMTENDFTFDYDDLEIDVKNDTDSHWNSPWPGETVGDGADE